MIPLNKPFCFTMRNLNLKSRSLKSGMKYSMEAEITADEYHDLEETDLQGIVVEVDQARITHIEGQDNQVEPENSTKPKFVWNGPPSEIVEVGKNKSVVVPKQDNGEPEKTKEPKPKKPDKPYGQLASLLYKRGFFHTMVDDHFVVCEAIGTNEQFLEWIRHQPCAKTGKFDYHKDEATGTTKEQCEPAHYNGDSPGKGIKADYSAIPLVHYWHDMQHRYGYKELDPTDMPSNDDFRAYDEQAGRDWMRAQAAKYREKWAKETLLKYFGYSLEDGFGNVLPSILNIWAKNHNLEWALPEGYRDEHMA